MKIFPTLRANLKFFSHSIWISILFEILENFEKQRSSRRLKKLFAEDYNYVKWKCAVSLSRLIFKIRCTYLHSVLVMWCSNITITSAVWYSHLDGETESMEYTSELLVCFRECWIFHFILIDFNVVAIVS